MYTDLWSHALALYARPGVEAACLALQDSGCDVCLLLCGTWLQGRAVPVDERRLHALRSIAEPWQHEVIAPLRTLRRQWREAALKDPHLAALREQLKALELDAERTLLERLADVAGQWPEGGDGPMDWLVRLASEQARGHDALEWLRAAARQHQDAEDGD